MKETDRKIVHFMQYKLSRPWLDRLMMFFTFLGDYCLIWIIIMSSLWLIGERRIAYLIVATLLVTNAINNGLIKSLFRRKRPFEVYDDISIDIPDPYGSSFPSGHSATGFCCAVMIMLYNPYAGMAAYTLATCIAFSRMYLRVHFFTDVLVGSLVGCLCSFVILTYSVGFFR